MLRKTNLGSINPLALNGDEKTWLAAFLQQNRKSTLFTKNKTYSFLLCREGENSSSSYQFQFTHDILVRSRKESKNSRELRYEILANSDPLGQGGNGSVLLSEGNLKLQQQAVLFKPRPRAVKRQDWDPSNPRVDNIELAMQEYKNASKTTHLKVKPVAVTMLESQLKKSHPSAFMVMQRLPGRDLRHFVLEELYGNLRLTASQRIQLSLDILRKIKAQAHDIGLIHRDVKSENIMVAIELPETNVETAPASNDEECLPNRGNITPINDPHDVNLIDYSFSKDMNDPDSDPGEAGSIFTMPPEQFIFCDEDFDEYSEKSDCYAAGKTLAELWWAEPEANACQDDYHNADQAYIGFFRYAQHDTQFNFQRFLQGDLSDNHTATIKNVFLQLTRTNPKDRWSISTAIHTLENIQEERKKEAPAKSQLGF